MNATPETLQELLATLADSLDIDPIKVQVICQMLVRTTLAVRDRQAKNGMILTVGDTCRAADLFLKQLHGQPLPPNLPPVVRILLDQWLEGIKTLK